ncbi:hypothetical protein [Providencia alcalifaciens]|uniref:hypothetical protein n=1 Tax=Providencia alcalifaciens TaxID=126385 RepID=UPI0012B60433|nr:hypothetical protein [Providencia alcalifaciens]MTC15090.1 hypothetical protein [Providencia alcalifaciens]MTC63485.1 hypothetical protein [Providencia alcalifaciens]WGZ55011.1 hypothetical protein PO864_03225 [Providencia alcalifaciens]
MDKSRQQFEEWRSKNKSSTINLFDVWQASRESLINSLESVGYISQDRLNPLSENSDAITSSQQQYNKVIPLYKLDKQPCK